MLDTLYTIAVRGSHGHGHGWFGLGRFCPSTSVLGRCRRACRHTVAAHRIGQLTGEFVDGQTIGQLLRGEFVDGQTTRCIGVEIWRGEKICLGS